MASTGTSQSLRDSERAARTRLRQNQIRVSNILKVYDRMPPPPRSYRSYQRHEVYGPSDIPAWFCSSICLSPHSGLGQESRSLLAGEVECEVKLVRLPGKPCKTWEDIFVNDDDPGWRIALMLTVVLSPYSEVLVWWRRSPPAILASYDSAWKPEYDDGPSWCHMLDFNEQTSFIHTRFGITELFARLALMHDNIIEGLSQNMLLWANSVSLVRSAQRYLANTLPQTPPRPSAELLDEHALRISAAIEDSRVAAAISEAAK